MPRYNRRKRKLNKISLARAIGNPSRSYITHTRGLKLTSTTDRITWYCSEAYGSIPETKTIIESASAAAAFDADSLLYDYLVYNHTAAAHLRNLGVHECFMTMYIIGNKIDLLQNTANTKTDPRLDIMYHLFDGWDVQLAAAAATDANTGTEVLYTEDSSTITVYNAALDIYNSKEFLKKFFVVKKATVKMMPGDDVWVPINVPTQMYSHSRLKIGSVGATLGSDAETVDVFVKAFKGRWVLLRYHGAIGHEGTTAAHNSNATQGSNGYMHNDIVLEEIEKAKVLQVGAQGNYGVHMTTARDTAIVDATNLVGPTEFAIIEHNNDA